mmetsp:Transcript_6566/g.21030  ORF Transcript_6566/g.21030 Transcript_6566/m.21030 type:complete len:252 (+) Transcript_6566:82-837(+)
MCLSTLPRASQERSPARSTEKRNPLSPCATKTRERAAGANSAARRGRPEEKRAHDFARWRPAKRGITDSSARPREVASRRQPLRKVGSVHLVDRREVEAEAVVAQLDVLIDGVLALGVRVLRDLAPLAVVHRLWPTKAKEAAAALLAARGGAQVTARLAQLVDGVVHRERLRRDRLRREGGRPQLERAEQPVNRTLLLERRLDRGPVATAHLLAQASRPVVAPALHTRHIPRVRLLPRHQRRLCPRLRRRK